MNFNIFKDKRILKELTYFVDILKLDNINPIFGKLISNIIPNEFSEPSLDNFYINHDNTFNLPSIVFQESFKRLPIFAFFDDYYNDLLIENKVQLDFITNLNCGIFFEQNVEIDEKNWSYYDLFTPFIIKSDNTIEIIEKKDHLKKFLATLTYPAKNGKCVGILLSTLTNMKDKKLIENIYNSFESFRNYELHEFNDKFYKNSLRFYDSRKPITNFKGFYNNDDSYTFTIRIEHYIKLSHKNNLNRILYILDISLKKIKYIIDNQDSNNKHIKKALLEFNELNELDELNKEDYRITDFLEMLNNEVEKIKKEIINYYSRADIKKIYPKV